MAGPTAEANVLSKLQTLASRSDAAGGAVIPVENYSPVAAAYAGWTDPSQPQNYCSPGRANDVVRAIGAKLDTIVPASVKYIVLVGDDPMIPYGRIIDNTSFANEHGYATTFFGGNNNEYLSTYGLGFLPSDDSYGDKDYTGSGPHVPELAVSRLVETPDDIVAQVDRYISRKKRSKDYGIGNWRASDFAPYFYDAGVGTWRAADFTSYDVPTSTEDMLGAGSTPNPYGRVPVFHFPNRRVYDYGISDLADVIPIQDALNKALMDMLVAMEFGAFKQRWVTGIEYETDPVTGKPKPPPCRRAAGRRYSRMPWP